MKVTALANVMQFPTNCDKRSNDIPNSDRTDLLLINMTCNGYAYSRREKNMQIFALTGSNKQ